MAPCLPACRFRWSLVCRITIQGLSRSRSGLHIPIYCLSALGKIKIPIDQLCSSVLAMDPRLMGNEETIAALIQCLPTSDDVFALEVGAGASPFFRLFDFFIYIFCNKLGR